MIDLIVVKTNEDSVLFEHWKTSKVGQKDGENALCDVDSAKFAWSRSTREELKGEKRSLKMTTGVLWIYLSNLSHISIAFFQCPAELYATTLSCATLEMKLSACSAKVASLCNWLTWNVWQLLRKTMVWWTSLSSTERSYLTICKRRLRHETTLIRDNTWQCL